MKSKNTYKPKVSPSYKKGGKGSYKDKDIKRGDLNHHQGLDDVLNLFSTGITNWGTLSAIEAQQAELDSLDLQYGNLSTALGEAFVDMPGGLSDDGGYFALLNQFQPTGASQQLRDFADDIPGLLKPIKPTSTEFAENLQDIQERRTGTSLTQMSKTGLPTGTKQILDAAAQGDIQTQEKVANLKMEEQKMEQERDKFLSSLTQQTLSDISQQDLSAESTIYGSATDIFGDVTSSWGDLKSSIIAGNVSLAGALDQAQADLIAGILTGIGEIIPDDISLFGEKGMKVKKYQEGAKVEKEYDKEGEDKDMLPAGDNNMTPGKFSHNENPIDIVQKRPNGNDEKIGEMTGGEGIIAPKDMLEIEAMLEKDDKKGVFNKMEMLIERFNAVAEANAEKRTARESVKEQKAKTGARVGYSVNPKLKY
jgi:hypothetical protein